MRLVNVLDQSLLSAGGAAAQMAVRMLVDDGVPDVPLQVPLVLVDALRTVRAHVLAALGHAARKVQVARQFPRKVVP